MDELQDNLLPLYDFLRTHSSTLYRVSSTLTSTLLFIKTNIHPYLSTLISKLSTAPDLASIALLLVLLFISLKILNLLVSAVMWWVRLFFRLVFWGAIIGVGVWIASRGGEGVVEDLGRLADTWKGEYGYWSERQREAVGARGRTGGGAGYNAYGRGRTGGWR